MKLDWQHVAILAIGGVFTGGLVWYTRGDGNLGVAATAGAVQYIATLLALLKGSPLRPKPEKKLQAPAESGAGDDQAKT